LTNEGRTARRNSLIAIDETTSRRCLYIPALSAQSCCSSHRLLSWTFWRYSSSQALALMGSLRRGISFTATTGANRSLGGQRYGLLHGWRFFDLTNRCTPRRSFRMLYPCQGGNRWGSHWTKAFHRFGFGPSKGRNCFRRQ
jgi:hypothetical protein